MRRYIISRDLHELKELLMATNAGLTDLTTAVTNLTTAVQALLAQVTANSDSAALEELASQVNAQTAAINQVLAPPAA